MAQLQQHLAHPDDTKVLVITRSDAITSWFSREYPPLSNCSLVVHIGGRTTEVVTYQTIDDRAVKLTKPKCVMIGGSNSNADFLQYISKDVVKDEYFTKYMELLHSTSLQQSQLQTSSTYYFEQAKIDFINTCNVSQKYFGIDLPPAFVDTYTHELTDTDLKLIKRSGFLQISSTKMQEIIDKSLSEVFILIDAALREAFNGGVPVGSMYLIGKFGSSRYIRDKIFTHYNNASLMMTPLRVHSICDEFLVVHGSLLCCNNMPLIRSSVSYGIGCAQLYSRTHLEDTRKHALLNDEGRFFDYPKFHSIIHKGDLYDPHMSYKFTLEVTPLYAEQTVLNAIFYTTEHENVTMLLDSITGDLLPGITKHNDIKLSPKIGALSQYITVHFHFYFHDVILKITLL